MVPAQFVLLLSDVKLPFAQQAVERVRSHVESMVVFGGRAAMNITLSAGVAEHNIGEPGTVTLQRADTALYRAKEEGRNRIVCA